MSAAWIICLIGVFIVFCAMMWAIDRSHRRNLEEHNRKMDEIYRKYR